MNLNDVIDNWDGLNNQKKRQALQAVINFIDFEDPNNADDDLVLAIIETARDFENEDYFGTEGLTV